MRKHQLDHEIDVLEIERTKLKGKDEEEMDVEDREVGDIVPDPSILARISVSSQHHAAHHPLGRCKHEHTSLKLTPLLPCCLFVLGGVVLDANCCCFLTFDVD